jgi:hypothetical protein
MGDSSKPLAGTVGVTFSLYKEEQGGAPLWVETQNVQPDNHGHDTVMLGSASSQGLPADLFTAGEPRWIGVRPQGQTEQPRVMLASVPYAMKASDAATVGGLPASAFMLAPLPSSSSSLRCLRAPAVKPTFLPSAAPVPPTSSPSGRTALRWAVRFCSSWAPAARRKSESTPQALHLGCEWCRYHQRPVQTSGSRHSDGNDWQELAG